jgi:transcriptional regulator with XRE-family HTH domain
MTPTLIGEYLRARREQLRPEDVGLPAQGRRRTPGLRREELAMLAGISSDYYVRLEQGRDCNPSPQVVDALARALRLDDEAAAHLHELARPSPRRRRPRRPPERVPGGIAALVASWSATPAIVQGPLGDVLCSNPLARALSPMFTPGVNAMRATFLHPEVRELYGEDWETVTEISVAGLRAIAAPDLDDPGLIELVGELSLRSERFRTLWARHDVKRRVGGGVRRFQHPQIGPLQLAYEKLAVVGTEQTLVVYHAAPGSASARGLALLGALACEAGTAAPSRQS